MLPTAVLSMLDVEIVNIRAVLITFKYTIGLICHFCWNINVSVYDMCTKFGYKYPTVPFYPSQRHQIMISDLYVGLIIDIQNHRFSTGKILNQKLKHFLQVLLSVSLYFFNPH